MKIHENILKRLTPAFYNDIILKKSSPERTVFYRERTVEAFFKSAAMYSKEK